jgi:hypothetical protein
MPTSPIAALVANANIAKAIIDAAIVADVRTPIATVKSVAVMIEAPITGRPESSLVRSLNPAAGHPVIAARAPRPITWRPEIVVARSRWLIVFRQRRRRLRRVARRLNSIARIIRALVISSARARRRSALLLSGIRRRTGACRAAGRPIRCGRGICIYRSQVSRRRVRGLILRAGRVVRNRHRVLTLGASCKAKHGRHGKQRYGYKS